MNKILLILMWTDMEEGFRQPLGAFDSLASIENYVKMNFKVISTERENLSTAWYVEDIDEDETYNEKGILTIVEAVYYEGCYA